MQLTNLPIVSKLGAKALFNEESVCLEVYVAGTTKNGDEVFFFDTWVNNIRHTLCRLSGGCTELEATGYWGSQGEPVTILRCHTTRYALSANAATIKQVLVQYGQECEQEAVGFTLNGEFFVIDPKEGY